jgi:predicted RNA-binding protein Jag
MDNPPFEIDEKVQAVIADAMWHFQETTRPFTITGLSPFQRKQIHQHFERTGEYKIRTFRDEKQEVFLNVYPVGGILRMAETKLQEVLMTGESVALPPMDSFERFIVHEYINSRGGVRTESAGENEERYVAIYPVFGRVPKKAKRRLTR